MRHMINRHGGQGYEQGSSWTRGQGWAIYGFIQSYQWTKEQRYLETAKKVADYFIQEAKKSDYKITGIWHLFAEITISFVLFANLIK